MNKKLDQLSEKARNLTDLPGVYLMKNAKKEIIYIGKAKNLKNRVSSYFVLNNPSHNEKVRKMVSQVDDFDYIVVDSEFEALVLECSLIKQNTPKYNILLKDDKGYSYIKITKGDYPKITAELQRYDDGADYIGPYTSSFSVKQTVEEVNKIFKLPTCNKKFPQDMRKSRPCLNFYIKQCMGVCKGKITKDEYNDNINEALAYIKKGSSNLVTRLTEQMEQASENLDFEKAAKLRDRILAIKKITETQKVYMINQPDQDVIGFSQNLTDATVAILKFRNAQLVDKEDYSFNDIYDLSQTRQEFLNQFYLSTNDIPKQIIIDEAFEGMELLSDYLSQKQGTKVTVKIPAIGDQKKLVEMAQSNASEKLSKKVERTGREVTALAELTKLLGLPKTPEYIEAYDISNLGDSSIVGGMVVFYNGRPLKKAYKKFKVSEGNGQDDYRSMREVISRRFERYFEEKDNGEGFGRLPDLILLDGGKGHVAAIKPILEQMKLDIPLFGMVKDAKHRTRAIAIDGGEISIASYKSAFSFVTNIQDEVHRFSINYQKKVHKKSSFEITLTRVDGIGEKKAATLLKTYKTKAELKKATIEQLRETAKINEKIATELYHFIQEL
ncbi:excinuclease ABC subunit UvrC [Paludicola sp. MB14-C6]|uniref:excinuclease ABC subunit UvrC n=1 Tax=Paludihabitans sp. MB14-C6 TaxID=3070656 RepID=UPI0027DC8A44|nr:excinuclease ABC subunit UvrC [Paludicola sp. MB14-C6]WMJ22762.1 excinuclease ABC subunit UvrC [Paludicola sp. MB14-C6]